MKIKTNSYSKLKIKMEFLNTVNMIQQHLTGNQFKKLNSQIDSCKDMINTNCVSSIQALNE